MDTRSPLSAALTTEEKASLTSGENFWETKALDRVGVPSLYLTDGDPVRRRAGRRGHRREHGYRDGREVVQVYVGVPGSAAVRPVRELKGFANVEIPAGASRTVRIPIPFEDLAYFDAALSKWVVDGALILGAALARTTDAGMLDYPALLRMAASMPLNRVAASPAARSVRTSWTRSSGRSCRRVRSRL